MVDKCNNLQLKTTCKLLIKNYLRIRFVIINIQRNRIVDSNSIILKRIYYTYGSRYLKIYLLFDILYHSYLTYLFFLITSWAFLHKKMTAHCDLFFFSETLVWIHWYKFDGDDFWIRSSRGEVANCLIRDNIFFLQ